MSEVTDLVMPILQRLQTDAADVKRKLDTLSADISRLGAHVRAMQERIGALEDQR